MRSPCVCVLDDRQHDPRRDVRIGGLGFETPQRPGVFCRLRSTATRKRRRTGEGVEGRWRLCLAGMGGHRETCIGQSRGNEEKGPSTGKVPRLETWEGGVVHGTR